jgi:GcrA cell cycle regulator
MTMSTSNGRDYSDEEIATLKREWAAGKSAKQIAAMLTNRSRNAVIGKLNRLGISDAQRVRNPDAKPGPRPGKSASHLLEKRLRAKAAKPVGPKSAGLWEPDAEPFVPPKEELEIPLAERKTVETLEDRHCRWPIGDPQQADFYFCGRGKVPGLPYCEHHARRAFQPPSAARQKPTGGPFVFVGHPGTLIIKAPAGAPSEARETACDKEDEVVS